MARDSQSGSRPRRRLSSGYTYLGLLFMLALGGAGLARYGEVAATAAQRERERELLFRGEELQHAIEAYARATPAGHGRWPRTLHELLEDKRHPKPRHHLRRIYTDPFTGRADWALLPAPGGESGFAGVHSVSRTSPLGRQSSSGTGMPTCVCQWTFVARP